jgi:hypothetical protein
MFNMFRVGLKLLHIVDMHSLNKSVEFITKLNIEIIANTE